MRLLHKIDLHKMRHEDAIQATIRFIESHWSAPAELEIITGNSTKMRNIVVSVLDEYKLSYQIGREFDLNNRGYIIAWIE